MTRYATFGDLVDAARVHLRRAAAVPGEVAGDWEVQAVAASMKTLLAVLTEYVRDVDHWYDWVHGSAKLAGSPWPGACAAALRELLGARWYLPDPDGRSRRAEMDSERARELTAAARVLVVGRDLLGSHVRPGPGGERDFVSVWAPQIASQSACRAMIGEVAALARQVAAVGSGLIRVPFTGPDEVSGPRTALEHACQHLRVLHGAAAAAHAADPVLADDSDLLRAVPLNAAPTRQVPDGAEQPGVLCQGVASAAERLRHSVRQAGRRAVWLPDLNADSLRQAAAAAVAASHNSVVILDSLASRTGLDLVGADAARLEAVGGIVREARDGWLRVARALDLITSDVPRYMASEVADVRDLALWTGRLAYADPTWTLSSGPRHQARPARDLAAQAEDAADVIDAVHHASHALRLLAEVHQEQTRSLARARRLMVPTRSLREDYDVPRPHAFAPQSRSKLILTVYRQAREANVEADAAMAELAVAARTPSRVLAIVTPAVGAQVREPADSYRAAEPVSFEPPDLVGPVERSLRDLGTRDPDLVSQAAALDRAGEHLLIEAATGRTLRLADSLPHQPESPRQHAILKGWVPVLPGHEPTEREPGD